MERDKGYGMRPKALNGLNLFSSFSSYLTLSANPTKWSNTFKQFVGISKQIVWVCLTIMWGWRLKG